LSKEVEVVAVLLKEGDPVGDWQLLDVFFAKISLVLEIVCDEEEVGFCLRDFD
jgi:hypothetical protein